MDALCASRKQLGPVLFTQLCRIRLWLWCWWVEVHAGRLFYRRRGRRLRLLHGRSGMRRLSRRDVCWRPRISAQGGLLTGLLAVHGEWRTG